MKFLKRIWYGVKVGLAVALKLQEKGVIKVKELPKIEAVVAAIEEAARAKPPPSP